MKKEVAITCIKTNADYIVKTFFDRMKENDGNSLWWSEKALAELAGIKSTLFFLFGKGHEVYKYVSDAEDKIINR